MSRTSALLATAVLVACSNPAIDGGDPDAGTRDSGGGTDAAVDIPCMVDFDCPDGLVCGPVGLCAPGARECAIADCQDGLAQSCDGSDTLRCSDFGASCTTFTTPEGGMFRWCDCGGFSESEGVCQSSNTLTICQGGAALIGECPPGTQCMDSSSGLDLGCYCDDVADGVCPGDACTEDPDCADCTPVCGDRVCGDNRCGGTCGECSLGETCTPEGQCQGCIPDCRGRTCGPNGCGGACGSCDPGETCNAAGTCDACVVECEGRVCGSNGCGGTCGSCDPGETCTGAGTCSEDCTFERRTYQFERNESGDWPNTNNCSVRVTHTDASGDTRTQDAFMGRDDPSPQSVSFANSCGYNANIEVSCSMRGGVRCETTTARSGIVGDFGDPLRISVSPQFEGGDPDSGFCFVVVNTIR